MCSLSVWTAGEGQQTREQAHDARTEAGTHPVQICDFDMETHSGKKYTADDLQGFFSIIMFGDSVTDHALQGLHKMQEIIAEQGEQSRILKVHTTSSMQGPHSSFAVFCQHRNMSVIPVIIHFYQAVASACLKPPEVNFISNFQGCVWFSGCIRCVKSFNNHVVRVKHIGPHHASLLMLQLGCMQIGKPTCR